MRLFSRQERLGAKFFDWRKVFDVCGDQGGLKLNGGRCNERVGQAHAVRQRQLIYEIGCAFADGWCDRQDFGVSRRQPLFQPRQVGVVTAALRQLNVGCRRGAPSVEGVQSLGCAFMSTCEPYQDV